MSDLFKFFDKANKGEFSYVDTMSEEEMKAISPFVLLGWGLGAQSNNEIHTIMTDAYMNDKVFSLGRHPRLLLKLFIAANSEIDNTRYKYVKAGGSKSTKDVEAIARYYNCGLHEARDYARILDEEEKKQLVKMMED